MRMNPGYVSLAPLASAGPLWPATTGRRGGILALVKQRGDVPPGFVDPSRVAARPDRAVKWMRANLLTPAIA